MYSKIFVTLAVCCGWATQVLGAATTCETDEQSLWANRPIDTVLESKLATLFQCVDTSDPNQYKLIDASACNWFVGQALATGWGFADFKNGDGFFTANELASGLANGQFSHWTSIGTADQQASNDTAAIKTTTGNPVIAVWPSSGPNGHVALILPGGLANSPSWNLNVPRSASVSLDDINMAYIGCRLSNAFGADKIGQVQYYFRDLLPFP